MYRPMTLAGEESKETCVIVLGARCGSSLTAEMLINLGVWMGSGFQKPSGYNMRGFFEDKDFSSLVISIHGALKRNPIFNPPIHLEDSLASLPFSLLKELKDAVDKNRRPLWGFKRAGAMWILDWFELFIDNPRYVLCTRPFEDSGKSLARLHETVGKKIDYEEFQERYYNTAKSRLAGRKYIEFPYYETLDNPRKAAEKLANFIGVSDEGKIASAAGVVRKDLRTIK